MKILIDTNVIIDALTSREPWNESAEKIFIMAANNIVDMYITASSATDIYYMVRKHLHNAETARQVMSKLYSLVGILEVKQEDCIDALASPITDYEDAVVEQVARKSGVECIVTRNQKDYEAGLTKVFLPDDFIQFMEQTE
jgi:predicted nucleic acid-binding protein